MLGERAPYALIFFAVVIAAVIAGWRSGLVALTAGQALAWYAIVEPRSSLAAADGQAFGALLFSAASQLLILAVIYFYQREVAHASAEQERQMDLLSEALQEIDHRTRNNYQTVVAVILLQAQRATHPAVKEALQDAADRVKAVSLASDHLALRSEDLGTVRLGDHLRELCEQIRRGMSRDGLTVKCEVADVTASAEKAIFISIIVNELVTNALKHAFRDRPDGEIRVRSKENVSGVEVIVEDNGAGLEPQRPGHRSGLGTRLVERFVSQIGAVHEVTSSSAGTAHLILVPSLD
jgi:two-component sensor histidine kinase